MDEIYYGPNNCTICGAQLNTDCSCRNQWRSDHNAPTGQFYPQPVQPEVTFSNTPEVVVAIRELVAVLNETKLVLKALVDKVKP